MKQIHRPSSDRISQILSAALKLSVKKGYANVTRDEIASETGLSPSLISHHCGTMVALRRDIMREAIRVKSLQVIAQGLAARDPHTRKIPNDLRFAALQSLSR